MAFTVVTVTADYDLANGLDPVGTVSFTPSVPMVNGKTVVAAPVSRSLDIDGVLLVDLVANNDPGTTPVGTTYLVQEQIGVGADAVTRTYSVTVPYNAGPIVDLTSLGGHP